MTTHDKATIFFCAPDAEGVQAHYWDGESGLLCRPPKGAVAVERALCQRHRSEADRAAASKGSRRSRG